MSVKQYLYILLFCFILFEVDEVSSTTKNYWNEKLYNVSMPKLLEDMLPNQSGYDYEKGKARFNVGASAKVYSYHYDLDTPTNLLKNNIFKSIFIREEDLLKPGAIHELKYGNPDHLGPAFISQEEQQTKAPFKSQNYTQLLEIFSIDPTAVEAQLMNFTLLRCESSFDHVCISTLEGMADYLHSEFQPSMTGLEVFSVKATPEMEVSRRYRITKVKRAGNGSKVISCHKGAFPYGVFMCHKLETGRAYKVILQSLDKEKMRVDTFVSCHLDTSSWSPQYGAFDILKLTPGQTVCHFMLGDSLMVYRKLN